LLAASERASSASRPTRQRRWTWSCGDQIGYETRSGDLICPRVAATETALAQLLAADLSQLDLVGLMIDGVHFGEHCCVVALGIGVDGAGATGRWRCAGARPAWSRQAKQFRRVNGHLHLRSLRDTLERVTQPVGDTRHDEDVQAA
jgi:hypothetical protein